MAGSRSDVSLPLYSACCLHAAAAAVKVGGGAVPAASCRNLGVAAAEEKGRGHVSLSVTQAQQSFSAFSYFEECCVWGSEKRGEEVNSSLWNAASTWEDFYSKLWHPSFEALDAFSDKMSHDMSVGWTLPAVTWGPVAAGGEPGAAEGSGLAAEGSAASAVELSLEVSS